MLFTFINNDLLETSSVLRISGPDAYTYLQGQFTQDLNRPSGAARYGLWLNQRGKVVADSFVLRNGDNDFLVASYAAAPGALRARLESCLVADEVVLADETDVWSWFKLWGAGAAAPLSEIFGSAPAAGSFVKSEHGLAFRGSGASGGSFEWLVPRDSSGPVAARMAAAGGHPADALVAERDRIFRGEPAVPVDIGPGDLPNEAGLDETALSHTKGCYLGQEVMARLKNLGQVRRRLHIVRGPGAVPPPRTALFQGGRKVGETRSAAPAEGGFVAMAMLTLLQLDPGAGVAADPDGAAEVFVVRCVG